MLSPPLEYLKLLSLPFPLATPPESLLAFKFPPFSLSKSKKSSAPNPMEVRSNSGSCGGVEYADDSAEDRLEVGLEFGLE
jgi:hypothetical protein